MIYLIKLTESDITSIRKLYINGVKIKDLAERYNVSTATIGNVISNKKYREII